MENNIICDTDCLDCKFYFVCDSEMKLDDETRDYWLNERDASQNMVCDNTGYCSESMSCPNYYKCRVQK